MHLPADWIKPLYFLDHVFLPVVGVHNCIDLESYLVLATPLPYVSETIKMVYFVLMPANFSVDTLIKAVTRNCQDVQKLGCKLNRL